MIDDVLVLSSINGVVVTWVVAIDPPGVRFPLNAYVFIFFLVLVRYRASMMGLILHSLYPPIPERVAMWRDHHKERDCHMRS